MRGLLGDVAVTRAVGAYETVEADTLDFEVLPGDQFLMCSDGLHAYLKDKHAALLAKLENDRAMDKDAEAELTAAIGAFKKTFA